MSVPKFGGKNTKNKKELWLGFFFLLQKTFYKREVIAKVHSSFLLQCLKLKSTEKLVWQHICARGFGLR